MSTRRNILCTVGVVAAASLAGCDAVPFDSEPDRIPAGDDSTSATETTAADEPSSVHPTTSVDTETRVA